ncbi:SDR family NAD(P)-dependent oxidoreductase [Phaeobacter gallaeciensis]|uniref:SDR family NAD(P)-dependent oxidoreductase n=1 Tax=Phaeobacter gallaeciensis TaxID=60890 RepID=UPI00237F5785|nr:SDR family oxidoreductase [Phaeobacter gallaeciensis]MDE4191421.1 SDR family NAD(P)-dependent oxidoreductase [Phaeobacter gallaeciensis]MDE4199884.1 SDR family NAD(P)-dependent oxidoreductase [Phaeobacter gallaeciensis]MDE4204034.1 SDR family NAD(P)-dependent oxidoreductase [Phaeobacter gallaeciensis]MDE4208176.1 SDR family NAD(P)-dependent oxidoreductase [Phaeobacter gallaeciensis]MDE4216575.1 SDR family NAD(P)-dependent oxidoreductase [Phaeobacter gallaeciensis]
MSFSISGKTAIVTGASSGIGLAIGKQFADAGANVMFADTNEAALIAELGEQAEESNIRYFAGDLRERLTIANLLSATIDAFDDIDILVNGARQVVPSDPLDPKDESLELLLTENLLPTLRLSQQAARRMIKQGEGREPGAARGAIINLSSIAARRTHPDLMAYSVASAALDQLTRSLSVSYAPHGVRVNSIAFGSVMSASLRGTLKDNRAYRQDIEDHTPLGRIAAPTELTETAQFLASDAASFMTGQIVTVDGGRTLLDSVAAPVH